MNKIAIVTTHDSVLKKAQTLASQLHLSIICNKQIPSSLTFLFIVSPERLELRENNVKHAKPLFVDFLSPKLNYRTKHGGGKNQLLAKAIGLKHKKNLFVIDATAGFGVDSFVLAYLGCEIIMLERSLIIYALLKDGLEHLKNKQNQSIKITLEFTQAFDYINKLIRDGLKKPDVIYIDPMYPECTKSALNKKTMRILREIVGDDSDAPKLLEIALKCAKNRVVVKRPKHANYLGNLKPELQLFSSGSSRYDIYFPINQSLG